MCSAVRRRMLVNGTISSRPSLRGAAAAGPAGSNGGAATVGASGTRCGTASAPPGPVAPPARMTDSTSSRVIRPPTPVPTTAAGSMPCSSRSLRTTGESTFCSAADPAAGGADASGAGAGAGAGGTAATTGGGAGGAGGAAAAAGGGAGAGSAAADPFGAGRGPAVGDDGQAHAHVHRLALGDEDLGDHPARRGGDLGIDLVGRHLEERLVPLDRVADGLVPLGDRALGHGLAQLRHGHVRQGGVPFRSGPVPSRRTSPTATGAVGGTGPPPRGWPPS